MNNPNAKWANKKLHSLLGHRLDMKHQMVLAHELPFG